ncbi:MAG: hypothetical protein ACO3QC_09845, partial [Phycisphaerales bacterium]
MRHAEHGAIIGIPRRFGGEVPPPWRAGGAPSDAGFTLRCGTPMTTGPTVYLETFGCQMNELDSELVRGHLRSLGYRFVDDFTTADVVLYNTCSVRE